jgi:LuxR family maltose regulon positive regulatory protein
LLDVSVLDQFTADLAGAVVDRPAGHLVDQLLAEHLFVASIDERRERFRLHHLIRDLLLADLEATDPARVRVLRRRAAKWYEAQGDIGASVEHLVAAGDNDDAIALIQNLLDQIYLTGQLDSGIQWLQQVPHEHLEQRPTAASMLARMLTERGWFDDARAWIDVAARAAMTELEQLDVIRARVRLEHALGKEAEVLSTLAELDSLVDFACEPRARELAASEQASTLAIRAMSHEFLGQEENRRAALTDLERRRPQLAEATAVVVDPILARAYAEDGELRTAASQGRLAIRRARRKGLELPALAHAYLAMAQVEWCQGRLDEAEAMLRDAVQLDDGGGVWIRTLRAVRAAEILASLGRHDQVDDVLESAWQGTPGARTPPTSRWMIAGWGLAINAIHGRRESAYSWLAELDRFQAPNSAPAFLWAEAELLKGNPNAVVTRFGPDGDSLPRQPLPRLRCGLALARALDATDRETELVPLVEELLAHAEVNDLLQPLLESRELLVRIGSTWSVVSSPRFLGRIRAPKPRQVAPPPIAQLPEPISPRELDLIRLLPTRLTNQEIASELYVSLNTVKSHLRSIYRKLGATSRDGAIGRCRDLGLLDEGVPSSPQRDDDGLRSVQQA